MILYNIIKDEWARNKSKDDSTVSVRYKFPINLPKQQNLFLSSSDANHESNFVMKVIVCILLFIPL